MGYFLGFQGADAGAMKEPIKDCKANVNILLQ